MHVIDVLQNKKKSVERRAGKRNLVPQHSNFYLTFSGGFFPGAKQKTDKRKKTTTDAQETEVVSRADKRLKKINVKRGKRKDKNETRSLIQQGLDTDPEDCDGPNVW